MKFAGSALAALLLVAAAPTAHSFAPTITKAKIIKNNGSKSGTVRSADTLMFLTPEDLTDYMAKAHEAKIRAVKEVEDQKNAQIQALKGEISALKESAPEQGTTGIVLSSPPPSAGAVDLSSLTKEELMAKLVSYQQFMANYMVDAQQQKTKAVRAAEAATAAKYEGKLSLLSAASSSGSPASSPSPVQPVESSSSDTELYDKRNANVEAAAKTGKSRWGNQEVAKIGTIPTDSSVEDTSPTVNGSSAPPASITQPEPASVVTMYDVRNAKIAAAAAAGKSRWCGEEVKKATEMAAKITLPASTSSAVNLGQQLLSGGGEAAGSSVPVAAADAVALSMYDIRNARVAAAAAAGKSRWGSMENTKCTDLAANAIASGKSVAAPTIRVVDFPTSPEIEAADHGLRNDGGVGGPSLAERVNCGSELFVR